MNKQFKRLVDGFLIALVAIPILLVIALIVAAVLLLGGTTATIAVGVVLLILLLVPVIIVVTLVVVYFYTSRTQKITVNTPEQKYHFVFHDVIKMRDMLRVIWQFVKEERQTGSSWSRAIRRGYLHFVNTEFKDYFGELIKVNYGLDAYDAFMAARLSDLEVSFS